MICLPLICQSSKEVETYLDYSYAFSITENICSISTKKIAMNIYFLDGLSSSYIVFFLLQMSVRQLFFPDHHSKTSMVRELIK